MLPFVTRLLRHIAPRNDNQNDHREEHGDLVAHVNGTQASVGIGRDQPLAAGSAPYSTFTQRRSAIDFSVASHT